MKNKIKKLILNWLFGADKVDSYIELLHENIETYKQNQELRERCIEEIEAHIKTLDMTQEIINTLKKLVQVCENHGINPYEEVKNIKLQNNNSKENIMNFNWSKFTEDKYDKAMESWVKDSFNDDFVGAVNVGDICIEFVNDCYIDADDNEVDDLLCNFYVRHEDTGYSWEDAPVPYDYADGTFLPIPYGLTYEEFKENAEKVLTEYIVKNDKCWGYSLVEHANRPLEIW